ncbi:MAG: membrane protein insertase YidC [Planctomycetota bacterium]
MDKRTVLFIILSVLIWFGYIQFIAPRFTSKEQPAAITKEISQQSDKKDVNSPDLTQSTTQSKPGEERKIPTKYQQPSNIILKLKKLENNYFQATISNKGAAIESFTFKQYKAAKNASQLSIINSVESDKYALTLRFIQSDIDIENNLWEIVEETAAMIKFRYTTPDGLVIYKVFSLNKYNYTLDYNISLENISDSPITSTLVINGTNGLPYETYNFVDITGLHAYTDKENKWYIKEKPLPAELAKLKKSENIKSDVLTQGQDNVSWTGITSKYFSTILVPLSNTDIATYNFDLIESPVTNSASAQAAELLNLNFHLQTKELSLKPGETKRLDFIFYAGPKETSELATFTNLGFDKLLSYGWFGFISKILLLILAGLYGIFKNYGIAIIALTIIIKVILFPITKKGQVSMYRLQKLTPRIKALQEQYKNDKQRLGVEQLKLWKEYGVNPLSGCLPMLLQIPVFFGLYWALALAIELRQAPFMLWINDLSQADQLCKLPFPILGATYLHVLPLIMTISWLIQSLTQPKSPDPQTRQQQKLFVFMPLIFGILFYNVPSGLTLYWFTSTLLGIVEQIIIKKYYFK